MTDPILVGYKKQVSHSKTYIALGILAGIAIFGIWFFQVEPIFTYINPPISGLTTIIRDTINGFMPTLQSAYSGFMSNPLPYCIAGITAAGSLYGIISKLRSNAQIQQLTSQANQQLIDAQNNLVSQTSALSVAQTKIDALQEQIKNIPNQTDSLLEAQALLQKTITEKNQLLATIQNQNQIILDLKTKTQEKIVVK
jgi:hypothetical protein